MTADDAIFVRLSRMWHVGAWQHRNDRLGFGVRCCCDCRSALSLKYAMYLGVRALSLPVLIVALPVICAIGQFHCPSPIIPICIIAMWPLVIWGAKSAYRCALIRAMDISSVRKLLNHGYVIDVLEPRNVDLKLDLKNRIGPKHEYGRDTTEDIYMWKGFVDGRLGQKHPFQGCREFQGNQNQFIAFVCMIIFLFFYYGVLVVILIEALTHVSDIIVTAEWAGNHEYGAKLALVIAAAALGALCHLYVMHLIFRKIKLADTYRQMLGKAVLPLKSDNPKALAYELLVTILSGVLRRLLR